MTQTLGHYLAVVEVRNQAPDAIEADLVAGGSGRRLPGRWPGAAPTAASPRLGALTLAAEVGGGRHMASANAFLGFLRADPSEYSSGSRVHRGRLTKAGNAHLWAQLVESA